MFWKFVGFYQKEAPHYSLSTMTCKYGTESIPNEDSVSRWIEFPAAFDNNILKGNGGLNFATKTNPNGASVNEESVNWSKYLSDQNLIHKLGILKTQKSLARNPDKEYKGYAIARVVDIRQLHVGKHYENMLQFEVMHDPKDDHDNDNQAHSNIVLRKINSDACKKAILAQAKLDLFHIAFKGQVIGAGEAL